MHRNDLVAETTLKPGVVTGIAVMPRSPTTIGVLVVTADAEVDMIEAAAGRHRLDDHRMVHVERTPMKIILTPKGASRFLVGGDIPARVTLRSKIAAKVRIEIALPDPVREE